MRRSMILIALGLLWVGLAWANAPSQITYQGKLYDDVGNPLTGTYYIRYSVYTLPSGGAPGWTVAAHTVTVAEGLFTDLIDVSGAGLDWDLAPWYLEVWVGATIPSMVALSPREQITSVMYALNIADNAVNSAKIEDGTVQPVDLSFVPVTNPMTNTGDMIYGDPGSTPERLGIGSAGQVLTVSGGRPIWQTGGGGAWVPDGGNSYLYTILPSGGNPDVRVYRASQNYGIWVQGGSVATVMATSTTGSGTALYGQAAGSSGYGVYGRNNGASGPAMGVYGQSNSVAGIGVYGYAAQAAVQGQGGHFGVYGISDDGTGSGVYGENMDGAAGYGVRGTGYYGTYGVGINYGAWGQIDATHYGYLGAATTGAYGQIDAANFGRLGYFAGADSIGVFGQGNDFGGYFKIADTVNFTAGAKGEAIGGTGVTRGLAGVNNSIRFRAAGVLGVANAPSNQAFAIYGVDSSSLGYAGYFEGRVNITGALSLGAPLAVNYGGTGLASTGAAGYYLRSNGTVWVSSAIQPGDLPAGSGVYLAKNPSVLETSTSSLSTAQYFFQNNSPTAGGTLRLISGNGYDSGLAALSNVALSAQAINTTTGITNYGVRSVADVTGTVTNIGGRFIGASGGTNNIGLQAIGGTPTLTTVNAGLQAESDGNYYGAYIRQSGTGVGARIVANGADALHAYRGTTIGSNPVLSVASNVGSVSDTTVLSFLANGNILYSSGNNTGTLTRASLTSGRTWTLPDATGTVAVSATSPVQVSTGGDISCPTCLTTGSGAFIQNQNSSDQAADWRIAGYGQATSVTDGAYALYGYQNSTSGTATRGGVFGAYTTSSRRAMGVLGYKASGGGGNVYAVYGQDTTTTGKVWGYLASGSTNVGVGGTFADNATAGYGALFANTSTALTPNYGAKSTVTGATGTGTKYAVHGQATGSATSNYGVYGFAQDGTTNYGLYGEANIGGATANYGVYGMAGAGSGSSYGVYGTTTAINAFAVYGVNTNGNNSGTQTGVYGSANGSGAGASVHYGVYGIASGGGTNWAGYFSGRAYADTMVISKYAMHSPATAPTGAAGILYYDSGSNLLRYHNGTTWVDLVSAGAGYWTRSGGALYPTNSGDSIYNSSSADADKHLIYAVANHTTGASSYRNFAIMGGATCPSTNGYPIGVVGWSNVLKGTSCAGVMGILTNSDTPAWNTWPVTSVDAGVYGDAGGSVMGPGVYGRYYSTTDGAGAYGNLGGWPLGTSNMICGVYGKNDYTGTATKQSFGVYGTSAVSGAYGAGVYGTATGSNGAAVVGVGTGSFGIGVIGVGNNYAYSASVPPSGAGGTFFGNTFGVWGMAPTSGYAGCFNGYTHMNGNADINDMPIATQSLRIKANGGYDQAVNAWHATGGYAYLADRSQGTPYGVYGNSTVGVKGQTSTVNFAGVEGSNTAIASGTMGGYFSNGRGTFIRLAYYDGTIDHGFITNGTKSTVMPTDQGIRILFCPESPEVWFEDFGTATLINGKAHVEFESIFRQTVTIDEKNPMKVFLQPVGFFGEVTIVKGENGFDILEKTGTVNGLVDYRIVAKRKGMESQRLPLLKPLESEK